MAAVFSKNPYENLGAAENTLGNQAKTRRYDDVSET